MSRAAKRRAKLKVGSYQRASKTVTVAPNPWDHGADGPANRNGLVVEDAVDITPDGSTPNPNGVRRARRVDMLEVWHNRYLTGHTSPKTGYPAPFITTRQYNAADALQAAYEATLRAPGWPDNDRVQSSPKPDHAVTIQIDRIGRYHAIARFVALQDWPILQHCVINGKSPKGTGRAYQAGFEHLRAALDRLATALRI